MNARQFLDTNVLVYAYDTGSPGKQDVARTLLREAFRNGNAVVSAQVLGEFFVTVTRRIPDPLTVGEAQEAVSALQGLPVVDVDGAMVDRAIDTLRQYQISYWDALILAAAERAECEAVLSEDLSAGQMYHGVRVGNPFAAS